MFMRRLQRLRHLAGAIERGGKGQRPVQRIPLHQLEHQVVHFRGLLQSVNRRDVGMVQRRQRVRLAPEARQPLRIARELGRQCLDGHVAASLLSCAR